MEENKKEIEIEIDGKKVKAFLGEPLLKVTKRNNIYLPTLCYFEGMGDCLGTCRVCTIKWKRHFVAGCTLKAEEGMILSIETEELEQIRKGIVELLFVEGNHFCPGCEKSGKCDLQGLGYHFQMTAPDFHYRFNNRQIDFEASNLLLERNRCILCKRCTDEFRNFEGEQVFYFEGKGPSLSLAMDLERVENLPPEKIQEVVDLCPVGALLPKEVGWDIPYGQRKYDQYPIEYYSSLNKKASDDK